MAETLVIETVDLRKDYGGVEAVRGLNLRVPSGSIFALLGRNGAGKTSTIKILLGMSRPTSGCARVFGLAADSPDASVAIRRRTGFVSEEKDLYDLMTVEQIIRFTATFYPQWRRDLETRYLRSFELPAGRKVKDLSRGTRTKLALLLAFSCGAELLLLDEPTSGLDPAVTEEVLKALVAHVASQEMTVFLSSHHLTDVDQVADRAPEPAFLAPGVVHTERRGRVLSVLCSNGVEQFLDEAGALHAASVEVMPVTLKEIFLETVKGEN